MNKETKLIIGGTLGTVALLIGAIFLFSSGQKPAFAEVKYSSSDSDRPKAQTDKNLADIGSMSVNDEKTADFALKNAGTKPMQILNLTTSCHCTFGQIIYNGKESDKFSMNGSPGVITEIAPGDTATVRVIYIPSIMPVYGAVEREAYIDTNDPDNKKLVFSITMNVH